MSWLTKAKAGPVEQVPASLGEKLQWLRRFGKPRLGMYGSGNGWHACIDMNTNSKGTSFEVKSDFSHGTPIEAVDELIRRLLDTLAQLEAA